MNRESKILITGAGGLVGKNLLEALQKKGFTNILTPSSKDLDLKDRALVFKFLENEKPEYVFHLAAKVGGIKANIEAPVAFLTDNLQINTNVIDACYKFKVKKLINLGSSCIYPRNLSKQPMSEEALLTGELEPTNEGYALSKISALKLCEYYNKQYGTNFISLMPPNVYGRYEGFDLAKSHVISALLMRFYKAKEDGDSEILIWGTGEAKREFIYSQDLVDAIIFGMENLEVSDLYNRGFLNSGTGVDISIKDLSYLIKKITGFEGIIKFDVTKPEGMRRKLMDSSRLKDLGYTYKVGLEDGLKRTYEYYLGTLK